MAPTTFQGFSKAGIAAFNTQFHQMVDQRKLANFVTLTARHGKIVNLDAYGVQDISVTPNFSARNDSIFHLASMTKPITGTALMMLFEEGKWALDDPVAKHVPDPTLQRPQG
jgi:CubicO group peptidase (beta-lactamase class C family)